MTILFWKIIPIKQIVLHVQNIVKLLGVCTRNEPVYTVMEYMLYGDLKTYLLARRHLVNERNREELDEVSNRWRNCTASSPLNIE